VDDLRLLISLHSKRLNVDVEVAYENLMLFSTLVGIMENDGKLTGGNPYSTAKGLYQFVDGSVGPAINRLKRYIGDRPWMSSLYVSRDASTVGWEEQTLLLLGDLLGKRGSDRLMRPVMQYGNRESMRKAYLILHHTNPDSATNRRAEVVFNGTLNDDR